MQIHEITLHRRKKIDEALGGLGSFMSGLTGGMSDKYMDKTPGGVKSGLTGFKATPDEYGPGAQKPSTKWQDKYTALQKDPAVSSYVKSIAAGWAKNPQAAGEPTQGLATGATLQKTVPSLVTAAKQTNNNLTSTQIGQILAQKAPTIWKNTPDRPDPAKPTQVDKATAIEQLAAELIKQGVTVDGKQAATAPVAKTAQVAATAPVAKTAQVAATAPVAKTNAGGRVAGQLSQTPGAVTKRNARAQATQANTAGATAFNQMATQLGGKAPNTMANAPISKVNIAKPTNPNQPQQTPLQQATALHRQAQGQKPATTFGKIPAARVPALPGQMPAGVATSAQGKRMQKAYGKPRGGIQGIKSDLEEAVTVGPAADQYRTAFTKWADGQFATRVQETGTTVTMDAVRKAFPDLVTELKSALDKVVATKGTPQQASAVEEYAKLSVAGVQALAQMQKNKVSPETQQKNKQIGDTVGSVKQSLAQAGVDPSRLSQVGGQQSVRATGNPAADSLLKLSGFKI